MKLTQILCNCYCLPQHSNKDMDVELIKDQVEALKKNSLKCKDCKKLGTAACIIRVWSRNEGNKYVSEDVNPQMDFCSRMEINSPNEHGCLICGGTGVTEPKKEKKFCPVCQSSVEKLLDKIIKILDPKKEDYCTCAGGDGNDGNCLVCHNPKERIG